MDELEYIQESASEEQIESIPEKRQRAKCPEGLTQEELEEWRKERRKISKKKYRSNNMEKAREVAKKHYQNNKEQHSERYNKWYQENKETLKEKKRQKITCECGRILTKGSIYSHRKSNVHKELMALQNKLNNL